MKRFCEDDRSSDERWEGTWYGGTEYQMEGDGWNRTVIGDEVEMSEKMTLGRKEEIYNAILAEPCEIDFRLLNEEECSFAMGVVISAGERNAFKKGHFNEEQTEFLGKAARELEKQGIRMRKWE
ncbi:hypothetical protein [Anaeromicropila populeti]|uniref:Uncharacterized protein n=1 Tax=Anaeromicropila populeti TaxID=37658 RepID=A0A1I6LXG8_9FIRM|nr:hypothetical protein [Anaeromicropila populeti]SFS07992.1 hypothetical protein SAMN05661086_03636 [Anaeromicropila populeti]